MLELWRKSEQIMNKKNNKRRRESIERIESAFINFLETKDLHQITVSDICKIADINRSTFYANYLDVYDLADKIIDKIHAEVMSLYHEQIVGGNSRGDYLKLFHHVRENQSLYKTYFKLQTDKSNSMWFYNKRLAAEYFDNKNIDYHVEFFRNGFNALIKMWLFNGCKESPEELEEIIEIEYKGRASYIEKYFINSDR